MSRNGKVWRIVVLGGGTAGWMAAAGIAKLLGDQVRVELIESKEIGIVGVGEATLPHIRGFVERLGIDEDDFIRATHATYKLGIDFRDFARIGDSYIHPFGSFGEDVAGVPFHQFWLSMAGQGNPGPIGDYSMAVAAALANRFASPGPGGGIASSFGYAYQFDATLFGPFMRTFGLQNGVIRTEATVTRVHRDTQSGDVTGLELPDGRLVEGDLFIDCSGFRSLLLGDALNEPWEDWSHWLPCDRAAAMPCAHAQNEIEPYTRAIAMPAGWRWRIPLQHRVGNGYVFASSFVSEDEAVASLCRAAEGTAQADPRILRFRAGRRRNSWVGNVIAVGLSSGFLEPLESTSIYLAQMAITNLIELFPTGGGVDPGDREEFNRLVDMEYDRIRDFLILHYHATERDDSEFWNHVRTMTIPDTLAGKLELWRETGRLERYSEGLFLAPSWVAVFLGQRITPKRLDPRIAFVDAGELQVALRSLRGAIRDAVDTMPGHRAYLESRKQRLADLAP